MTLSPDQQLELMRDEMTRHGLFVYIRDKRFILARKHHNKNEIIANRGKLEDMLGCIRRAMRKDR